MTNFDVTTGLGVGIGEEVKAQDVEVTIPVGFIAHVEAVGVQVAIADEFVGDRDALPTGRAREGVRSPEKFEARVRCWIQGETDFHEFVGGRVDVEARLLDDWVVPSRRSRESAGRRRDRSVDQVAVGRRCPSIQAAVAIELAEANRLKAVEHEVVV